MLYPTPLKFHVVKLKIIGLLMLAVIMLVLGIFLIIFHDSFKTLLIGVMNTLLWSVATRAFSHQMIRKSPAMVMDKDGVTDYRTEIRLPWTEIESVSRSSNAFYFGVQSPERFYTGNSTRQRKTLRIFAKLGAATTGSTLSFSFHTVNPNMEEAGEYIAAALVDVHTSRLEQVV